MLPFLLKTRLAYQFVLLQIATSASSATGLEIILLWWHICRPMKSLLLNMEVSSCPETEDPFIRNIFEAAEWCTRELPSERVTLPPVTLMDGDKRAKALKELREYEGVDEEDRLLLQEPFLFIFKVQSDFSRFLDELVVMKKYILFASFEELKEA
ncbi:uncharacterized protein LOC111197416 [Astyanax mexicanus]|uniref:uncharacterized protein LOC111197416 n=1 Tax=Astyanax mexicanus TaxID=7994 RepID=UPI0020CA9D6D|nr:uncharacterized protein LOC111197416 [Astyanax mexicanus]